MGSTQETGAVVLDTLICNYSVQVLTWQHKEGPSTGLPALTSQTQWLIRPLQPPSGKTLKCLVFELELLTQDRVRGLCGLSEHFTQALSAYKNICQYKMECALQSVINVIKNKPLEMRDTVLFSVARASLLCHFRRYGIFLEGTAK